MSLFALSCATVLPPGGGPEDKTAPFVDTSAVPVALTNFREKSVWLHFSEYVDKARVPESIIISPEKRLEFSWSSRELEIIFAEPLDSNTTYALTLGTDYADLHGNKPKEAYTMIFSTGAQLDSGMIKGELADPNPGGAYIFLYNIGVMNPDTLDYSTTKPRYRTQAGSTGAFEFHALPYGNYRIIAVRDISKDGLFTPGADAFGTTTNDLVVSKDPATPVVLKVNQTHDLQPPQLVEVRAKTNQRLEVIFSENIDTLSVRADAFSITDTSNTKVVTVKGAFISTSSPKNVALITSSFETASTWQLKLRSDSLGVRDTSGLRIADSASTMRFNSVTESDTLEPALLSTSVRDSSRSIALKPAVYLVFSSALLRSDLDQRIAFFRQNTRIDGTLEWRGDNILRITPRDSLESETWYELRLRMTGIHGLNNSLLKDSTVRIHFQTADIKSLGAIKGELSDSAATGKAYVIMLLSKTRPARKLSIAKPGPFAFYNVAEGEYTLEAYADDDNNGQYSAGKSKPYSHAERFTRRPAAVSVKARWTVEDIRITFPAGNQ